MTITPKLLLLTASTDFRIRFLVLLLAACCASEGSLSTTNNEVQTASYSSSTQLSGAGLSGGKMGDLMILDEMLNTGYDRRATPTNHMNYATTVECELFIRSFGSISPSTMDYEVDLYLRQTWHDQRLNHSVIQEPLDLSDPNLVKAIWKPEVYFPNAKHGEFQYVTVPNVLVRINPQGYILYQLRLKLTFSCMMELSKFPLDNQICTMEVASFSKTLKELRLTWKLGDAVKLHRELRMPQFELDKIVTSDCQESYQIGNYSCLVAEFHLRRSIGYHLVQSYLPTILIVSISWVSFWMDVDAVPARTTLGITTLLTVSSKSSSIQGGLPQVSYVKAIDIWMGACTAFVFTALLEFTYVNYMWRKRSIISTTRSFRTAANSSSAQKKVLTDAEAGILEGDDVNHAEDERNKTFVDYKRISRRVDEVSRWLFPVIFFIFLLGYWLYYFF